MVYVYRNPKDAIVSFHHMMLGLPGFNYKYETVEYAVHLFVEDLVHFGPYFDHLESAWKLRNQPNVYITSYETLLKVSPFRTSAPRLCVALSIVVLCNKQ